MNHRVPARIIVIRVWHAKREREQSCIHDHDRRCNIPTTQLNERTLGQLIILTLIQLSDSVNRRGANPERI